MRKIIPLLLLGLCSTACIDKDYDLSKISTDDITIGNEDSEFKIPLAKINVGMDQFTQGPVNIAALFKEADIWLPSGLAVVELEHIDRDIDGLLTTFFNQLATDDTKLGLLTDLAWDEYRDEFMSLLQISGQNLPETQFKNAFKRAIRSSTTIQVHDKAKELARKYLTNLEVERISYPIGQIDIGSEVIDMLARNLDPKGTSNAKNTLALYGSIQSELPLGLTVSPVFVQTDVQFSVEVNPVRESEIPPTRLYEDDLRKIIEGVTVDIPVKLLRYYPGQGFSDKQKVSLTLRLIKRGGLSLDI